MSPFGWDYCSTFTLFWLCKSFHFTRTLSSLKRFSFYICLIFITNWTKLSPSCITFAECLYRIRYSISFSSWISLRRSSALLQSEVVAVWAHCEISLQHQAGDPRLPLSSWTLVPCPRTPSWFTSSFWWHASCRRSWGREYRQQIFETLKVQNTSLVYPHTDSQGGWLKTRGFPLSIMKAKNCLPLTGATAKKNKQYPFLQFFKIIAKSAERYIN